MSSSRQKEELPPWHTFLTLDIIVAAAKKSILHPFVAWMLPLSLRAVTVPYSHFSFQVSVAYAAVLTIYHILSVFNHRIAFGRPREVDHSQEVVVITGGAQGLGLLLAGFFRMRGASVAVLDVKDIPEDASAGLGFYRCDVGDPVQLADAYEEIKEDFGIPTILINNAAIMHGKPILELQPEEIERSFRVNLLSHFHTVRTVLPGMLSEGGGTIVTISSVLGYLGCANLADYTASKAGLLAFHGSLRAELKASRHPAAEDIKTILVAPGQLGTPLFAGVKTPSNFLAPIVEPIELAREIVKMIDNGESGEIRAPFYTNFVPLLVALPASFLEIARYWTGMDQAMIASSENLNSKKC